MTAPKLDFLIDVFDNKGYNSQSYDPEIKEKINTLYSLLETIKPVDEDEYKVLYFSVLKGNIEEYGDYEELKRIGDVKNYQEFVDRFNNEYPDDVYWYKMITTKYKNYCSLSINSKNVIYADMDTEGSILENYQLQEVLDFLILKVDECVKKLQEGTYNKYIEENYSYKNKFGVIKRNELLKLYPEIKKNFLNEISEEEIDYFLENVSDRPKNRINNMTSGKYFECVGLAYKKLKYEIGNLTDKELYLKYADGRDEGLTEINDNDFLTFDNWYNGGKNMGGHPFEIIVGHTFSRVNLYIDCDEKGYYLSLDGAKVLRKEEIAKIFNVLNKNEIPVKVYSVDVIKNAFIGNDYLGVVPNKILPFQCSCYFKKYKPVEYMHLIDEKMLEYIKWEPLEKIELK